MDRLILLALLPAIAIACGRDYYLWFDGRCFNPIESNPKACNSNNGDHLPNLKTQDENDAFFKMLPGYFGTPDFYKWRVWIGLTCNGEKFVWNDGTEATYTNFAETTTCDKAKTGRAYIMNYEAKWMEQSGTPEDNNVKTVCEADMKTDSPCDTLELDESSGTCYVLPTYTSWWTYAYDDCEHIYTTLPIIHDKKMNDFVRRTAVSNGILDGVHIGMRKDNFGNFTWTDGSLVDYSNFVPGFPIPGAGDCVAMQTVDGQWINIDCTTSDLRHLCTRPGFFPTNPLPVDSTGCPVQTEFGPGDEIFSPSYPLAPGAVQCDYFLLHPDSNMRAGVEITFLETNTCCDKLTFYEGIFGSKELEHVQGMMYSGTFRVWANSNAMKLRWNSTDGGHIRGFKARMIEKDWS